MLHLKKYYILITFKKCIYLNRRKYYNIVSDFSLGGLFMKNYRCPNCGQESKLTITNVKNMLISRKGLHENRGYFFSCPECGVDQELAYLDIPQKVRIAISNR